MWISQKVFNLISSNRDEVVKLRTELDALKDQLRKAEIIGDFLRLQINTLQLERQQLIEKAHGIRVPAPQIEKQRLPSEMTAQPDFNFDDVGEEMAKKLGLPSYN